MKAEKCAQYLKECQRDLITDTNWITHNFHLHPQEILAHLKTIYKYYSWTVKLVEAAYPTLSEEEKKSTKELAPRLRADDGSS